MNQTITAAESGYSYPVREEVKVYSCATCGILYGVAASFLDRRKRNGGAWYCPNGHSQVYTSTEADEQRQRADAAERRLSAERDTTRRLRQNVEKASASARAYKGHVTRMRNRISNGVCPAPGCKRSGFTQVMRHLATAHPEWLAEHRHEVEA